MIRFHNFRTLWATVATVFCLPLHAALAELPISGDPIIHLVADQLNPTHANNSVVTQWQSSGSLGLALSSIGSREVRLAKNLPHFGGRSAVVFEGPGESMGASILESDAFEFPDTGQGLTIFAVMTGERSPQPMNIGAFGIGMRGSQAAPNNLAIVSLDPGTDRSTNTSALRFNGLFLSAQPSEITTARHVFTIRVQTNRPAIQSLYRIDGKEQSFSTWTEDGGELMFRLQNEHANHLTLGRRRGTTGVITASHPYNGMLAEFIVYNRELDLSEIIEVENHLMQAYRNQAAMAQSMQKARKFAGVSDAGPSAHWLQIPKMRRIYAPHYPWIYQENHGWLYSAMDTWREGGWFFDTSMGNWWASCEDAYEWVFHAKDGWRIPEYPTLEPWIDEQWDVPGVHTGFPDPNVFKFGDDYYVFGTRSHFFRTRTFQRDDIEMFDLQLDFGEHSPDVRGIWGFSVYQHTDGEFHAYATLHFGSHQTVVAHLEPQEGEEWTTADPITKWRLTSILVGDPSADESAYESKVLRDDDGSLYLVTNQRVGDDVHIVAYEMESPAVLKPDATRHILLSPEGYHTEDRNLPGSMQIVESTVIQKIQGKYMLLYSVGDYARSNYKIGTAFADTLIPDDGYQKIRVSDPKGVWQDRGLGGEIYYVLQTQRLNWYNFVGHWVDGPGIGTIIHLEDGDHMIFHARRRGVIPERGGWHRYVWIIPVDINIGDGDPSPDWIRPRIPKPRR